MKLLQSLLTGLTITQVLGSTDKPIAALCFDSRQATPHSCFVAITGTQVDGHQYIPAAIASGSNTIVCTSLPQSIQQEITYIVVAATTEALGKMAANFYGHPSKKLQLIAVTGTNGKTTLTHLLYNMAMKLGYKAGMLSTICKKIVHQTYTSTHTTSDALELQRLLHLMATAGCRYCFMEVSSHALMQDRTVGLQFRGAIFTNITHEHLDYHLTFANYIKAKKKLFDNLSPDTFALVNQEDRNSPIMLQQCKAQPFTFSLRADAHFSAKVINHTLQGMELEIEQHRVWFQLIGEFNAHNLLAAYGTSQILGWNKEDSLVALSGIPPVLGRMNSIYDTHRRIQVIIDYAHTPDALEKVLATLRTLQVGHNRLLTVMGCGGNRDQQKRAMIGKILAEHSDVTIFTSDNPREEDPQEIIDAMHQGVSIAMRPKVHSIVDRAMAIKTACLLAHPYDIVLVAGKGHQNYEEIKGVKHFLCESTIIRRCLDTSI